MTDRPAEASFYDDPATADLAGKVSEAWAEFGRALTEALPALPVGATLELTLDPTASGIAEAVYSVTVSPVEGGDLRAFAIGNSLLPPEHRLSRTAVAELVALGWSPPGVLVGGDERFGLSLSSDQAPRVAAIVARTLRQVYGTPHPAFLVYTAQPAGSDRFDVPALGSARALAEGEGTPTLADLSVLPLPEKVAAVISAMLKTAPGKLPVDSDGDIGIRSGSAMVFVRVRDDPPLIDVFSPVLTGVDANERLYMKLSELTHRMPIGRLYCASNTVWASVPVFGREFQPTHLMLAVQVMTGLADELDDRLQGEFGGKRFFVESDVPGVGTKDTGKDGAGRDAAGKDADEKDDDRTGMYL